MVTVRANDPSAAVVKKASNGSNVAETTFPPAGSVTTLLAASVNEGPSRPYDMMAGTCSKSFV